MKYIEVLKILNNIKVIDYDTDGETCLFLIAEESSAKAVISALGLKSVSKVSDQALEHGQVDITEMFGGFDNLIDGDLWFTEGKGFHLRNCPNEKPLNRNISIKVGIEGLDGLEELLVNASNQVKVLKGTLEQIE